jgi:hypothetical protein
VYKLEKPNLASSWKYHVKSTKTSDSIIGEVDAVINLSGSRPILIPGLPEIMGDDMPQTIPLSKSVTFHSLDRMVDPKYVNQLIQSYPDYQHKHIWTVIGPNHSGMLVIKNLIESGVKHVKVIHRSPIRWMTTNENGCIKNVGTGLKGPVGEWAKQAVAQGNMTAPFQLISYDPKKSWIDQLTTLQTDHVIIAIGFDREDNFDIICNNYQFTKADIDQYDKWVGYIPIPQSLRDQTKPEYTAADLGLFGAGIAFPQNYRDEEGEVEPWVGVKRTIEQIDVIVEYFQTRFSK